MGGEAISFPLTPDTPLVLESGSVFVFFPVETDGEIGEAKVARRVVAILGDAAVPCGARFPGAPCGGKAGGTGREEDGKLDLVVVTCSGNLVQSRRGPSPPFPFGVVILRKGFGWVALASPLVTAFFFCTASEVIFFFHVSTNVVEER